MTNRADTYLRFEYDDYLDREYDSYTHQGVEYTASEILPKIDPKGYEDGFQAFKADIEEQENS
jgi:hypothetical protein